MPPRHELISLADFVDQIGISALLEARARECKFTVSHVDERLAVDVDRDILLSALGNLLQNAFKFTEHGTEVSLHAYAVADRILIDVEDHCGGLPPGSADRMFLPFTQSGEDRVRARTRTGHLPSQRRGKQRRSASPGRTRLRVRFHY